MGSLRRCRPLRRELLLTVVLCLAALRSTRANDEAVPLHRFTYQNWSAESGLPTNTVVDTVRDAEGYLWVATPSGLARFDGAVFELFRPGTTPGLGSSRITHLHRDAADRIWIATSRGVTRYESDRGFVEIPNVDGLGTVAAIAEHPSGYLLVGVDQLMRVQDGALEPDPDWQGPVTALLRQGRTLFVAGDRGRLLRLEAGVQEACRFPESAGEPVVRELAWFDNELWVGTDRGLFVGRCAALTRAPTAGTRDISAIAVDGDGVVWVASGERLLRFRPQWSFEGPIEETPFQFAAIVSLVAEEDGGIWLGSAGAGLRHLWRSRADQFGSEEGLVDTGVWAVLPFEDGLAIASNGGVDLLKDSRFERLIPHTSLPSPSVYSLLRDGDDGLWVGLRSGLLRFDSDLEPDRELEELSGLQVNGLVELEPGVVLVASTGGLFRFAGDALQRVGADQGLDESKVRYLLRDRSGAVWVGTENGLFVDREGALERFESAGLDLTYVTALIELEDGRILAGSWNKGLFVQDDSVSGFRNLGPDQGLPSNVFSLNEHEGWLVVSYRDGVYRVRLSELARDRVDIDLDLLHIDTGDRTNRSRMRCCNGAGHGRGVVMDGALYAPSLAGVVSVDLEPTPEPLPEARLIQVVHESETESLPNTDSLRLEPGVRDVEIHYGAVDLRQAWPLEFRYRLVDFDRDWVEVGNRRVAIYTNLAPGAFSFEVQAKRRHEPWGPTASFALVIPEVFVETWLFRIFLMSLAVPLVWLLVRVRVAHLRRQKAELEALVEARTLELSHANRRLEAMNEALAEASVTDPLTGLHNRRFFREQVPGTLARLARSRLKSPERDLVVGVLLIDIDDFKLVNDHHGHAVGDEVLKGLAQSLRDNLREGDVLVRWGGEEFLVLVAEVERNQLEATAERIRAATAESRTLEGADEPVRVTSSLGYAAFPVPDVPSNEQSFQTVLELADHALYAAKAAGRDRSATVELARFLPDEWPHRVRGTDIEAWCAEEKARVVISETVPLSDDKFSPAARET